MRRREFITLVGGAVAWPFAAPAQQTGKPSTIGILGAGSSPTQGQFVTGFTQRMRELGWFEARNLAIELRWGEGRSDDADAVILAWHQREQAMARRLARRAREPDGFPGSWMR